MKAFNISITISGINGKPEPKDERVIAASFEDALELTAGCLRAASFVPLRIVVEEADLKPFERKTVIVEG
jgi:hypothetical protein